MSAHSSIAVVIVAAGTGSRMRGQTPKQWLPLGGVTLVERALRSFSSDSLSAARQKRAPSWVTLVVNQKHGQFSLALDPASYQLMLLGMPTRRGSVREGVKMIPKDFKFIAVHDAVRPFWPLTKWDALVRKCRDHDGAILAVPVSDTLKQETTKALRTVERDGLWQAQTPQVFRAEVLREAHLKALREGTKKATDDAELVERLGGKIAIVPSTPLNFKITTPDDWTLAERVSNVPFATVRVGTGYDTHRLGGRNPLVLGGVEFASTGGLIGHSDGDALLHAICDALLGAAALGDIGQHFPPSDDKYSGSDSRVLLRETVAILHKAGYRPSQVDATVLAERPKIMPRADEMRRLIAGDLGVDVSMVSIKATTNEGMGFIGRGEGIAAQAVALIVPLNG